MPLTLRALTDLTALPFDEVIDVRSPAEFAEDHIPGAINLPVLDDAERARVGTIYVRQDRFLARKIGAALIARNAARHLQGPLADRDGGWRPLVYCWRGGQRSGSLAAIFGQIGWRVDTIDDGYRAYRRLVVGALYDRSVAPPVVLIGGGTGTAKTRLLAHLAEAGGQVIDLEAMANHRGSVFGPVGDGQPSQKTFESRLAGALVRLDPARPVYLEAESSKIGDIVIPPSPWQAMLAAPRIRLTAPLAARAAHLAADYADLTADQARLSDVLDKLVRYHGRAQVEAWKALAAEGAFATLAEDLIRVHYDPGYARQSRRGRRRLTGFDLPDLSDETLAATAREIVGREDGGPQS